MSESKFGPVRVYVALDIFLPGVQTEGTWVDGSMPLLSWKPVDVQLAHLNSVPSLYRNPRVVASKEFDDEKSIEYEFYWECKFVVINDLVELYALLANHRDMVLYCGQGDDLFLAPMNSIIE